MAIRPANPNQCMGRVRKRFMNHTVSRSMSTLNVRPMPYLLRPKRRARWFTLISVMRAPLDGGQRGKETVQLTVEIHVRHQLAAVGLQGAAVVVEAYAR